MQYWRSYEDLDRWARQLPHMRWWRWLLENAGPDLSFYHEIYQVAAAEAIYEKGCRPVGPALFADDFGRGAWRGSVEGPPGAVRGGGQGRSGNVSADLFPFN